MNHIEDNQSLVYLSRAFDRKDKTNIVTEQKIPKSTHVALVVFSRSDTPIHAYAGLGSDGLSRRIEPHQKKKFSFITSQKYTLRDLKLRVERNAEKELGQPKVKETASKSEEGLLPGQDLFRKRKREKEVHKELEKRENKKSKTESSDSLEKKRKREKEPHKELEKRENKKSKTDSIDSLEKERESPSSYESESSEESQKISNLSDDNSSNESAPVTQAATDSTETPKTISVAIQALDLDTGKEIVSRGMIPGHRIGLIIKNKKDIDIRITVIARNYFKKAVPITNRERRDDRNFVGPILVKALKKHDIGYILPKKEDGDFIAIDILGSTAVLTAKMPLYHLSLSVPIIAEAGSDLNINSGTVDGSFYESGSAATTLPSADNASFDQTGAKTFAKKGSRENF